MLDDITGLWWEAITGPLRLIEQTAEYLNAGKSVILQGADSVPWLSDFRDYVSHKVDAARFQHIDWDGDCPRNAAAPRLLRHLAPQHVNQCPSDEKRQQEFLKNERILAGTLVWVSPSEDGQADGLIRFISGFRGRTLPEDGAFVVEVPDRIALPQLSGRVETIRCGEYITGEDMRLFASILAENTRPIPVELKEYAAQLTAGLAGRRADLIMSLLHGIDFTCDDPIQTASSLLGPDLPADDHEMQTEEYARHIQWKAQLQTAFPGIEIERGKLIPPYSDLMKQALVTEYWDPKKERSGFVRQFGEEVDDPLDLELGTIVYMMSVRQNANRSQYLLYADDPEWRERIHFLHKCRNKLAHHNVVPPDTFYQLMQLIRG